MTRKEVRVEIKVRNNLILSMMEAKGIYTVAELAEKMGSGGGTIYRLVAMKLPARKPNGSWRKSALDLSEFFQCMPEDLFSDEQQIVSLDTNRATAEMAFAEIHQLMSPQPQPDQLIEAADLKRIIHKQLQTLTPREQQILALRFGLHGHDEHTFEAIAQEFGISHARASEIVDRALRQLKHPSRSNPTLAAAGYVKKRRGWRDCDDSERFDGEVIDAMKYI